MRAAQVQSFSGADHVSVLDLPDPGEDTGLVLEVHAAGVSLPDVLMSRGEFQMRREPPFVLGWEAAGVVAHASAESGFAAGDRVVSMALGAHAERVPAVPELTWALPDELSFEEGAAYPLNYLTAYAGLVRRAAVQEGERVLVQGAGGGVGSAAVQVATALGAEVHAVVSDEAKAEVALRAGAVRALLANEEWRTAMTDSGGADVVFDPVGGDRFLDSLRSLAPEGRLVVIGFAGGAIPELRINRLLLNNIDVRGCTWSVLASTAGGVRRAGEQLNAWVADGVVRPLVGARFPLERVGDALALVESRRSLGKAVVVTAAA